jgi:hypothetical protein
MRKTSHRIKAELKRAGSKGLTTRELVDMLSAPYPTVNSYLYKLYLRRMICRRKYLPFRYYCLDYLDKVRNLGLYNER